MRNSKFFVIGLLAMIIALVSGIYIGIEARGVTRRERRKTLKTRLPMPRSPTFLTNF